MHSLGYSLVTLVEKDNHHLLASLGKLIPGPGTLPSLSAVVSAARKCFVDIRKWYLGDLMCSQFE